MSIIEGHVCKKNNNGKAVKFQEEMYGRGRRVVNKGKAGYRCTCCGELIQDYTKGIKIVSGG